MAPWTARLVAVLLVASPAVAAAQANCEAIPRGPARTDCYLALSQYHRAQSDLPLTERSRSQTPRGIGQLPEQTLRNPNRVGDDKTASSRMSQRVARPRRAQLRSRGDDRLRDMQGIRTKFRMSLPASLVELQRAGPSSELRWPRLLTRLLRLCRQLETEASVCEDR